MKKIKKIMVMLLSAIMFVCSVTVTASAKSVFSSAKNLDNGEMVSVT